MNFGTPFGGLVPGGLGAVLAALMRTGAPLTGRQLHALVADEYGLWTVQQGLKELAKQGMTSVQVVGRAELHTINEAHVGVQALRPLLSPVEMLTHVVLEVAGHEVDSIVLFGSISRGEAHADSDVDLAVVAPEGWDRRIELEDAVRARLGNRCDVVHLTPMQLSAPPGVREPLVAEIIRDGVVLAGRLGVGA